MLKRFRQQILPSQEKGFTLIEILIAAFIGTLIILTMFSFLQGVLRRDEQESARSSSQEEIQAAIGFIADDLREATYIYDATGIAAINGQLPHTQQGVTDRFPVLVFWKRQFLDRDEEEKLALSSDPTTPGTNDVPVKCIGYDIAINFGDCQGGDQFPYTLVAYYLRNEPNGGSPDTWSKTSRIERWSNRGGVSLGICYPVPGDPPCTSTTVDNQTPSGAVKDTYVLSSNAGFSGYPDISSSSDIEAGYNSWTKSAVPYNFMQNPYTVLVDFIDDSPLSLIQGLNLLQVENNDDCIQFTGDNLSTPGNDSELVPANFATLPAQASEISGFYACVNSLGVGNNRGSVVQVFLRGNALARINNLGTPTVPYLPTATIKSSVRSTVVPE